MDAKSLRARAGQIAQSLDEPRRRVRLLCELLLECLREGDVAGADAVQQELLEEAGRARYAYQRHECLQHCIERVVMAGFVERAAQLMQALHLDDDEPIFAGRIAAAACRRGRRDHSKAFLQHWQAHYLPRCADPIHALDVAYDNLANYGGVALALELIESQPAPFSRALSSAAQALACAGRIEQAYTVAQQITDAEFKLSALGSVIPAAHEQGQLTLAHEAAQEARQLLDLLNNPNDKSRYACQLGRIFANMGEVDAALELLSKLGDDNERSHLLYSIVGVLAERGDYERALQLAEQIPHAAWRDEAYGAIVRFLADNGQMERAMGLLRLIRDTRERDSARASIAYGYALHGALNAAQAVLRQIRSDYEIGFARQMIGNALMQQGRYEEAAQWTSFNLLMVVDELIAQGDFERAYALLHAHTDSPAYEEGVLKLCRAYLKRGERDRAESLLQHVSTENAQSQILAAVARDLLRQKAWQAALETTLRIPKLNQRDLVLAQLARACAKSGDYATAVRIAEQIFAPARLAETLQWIAARMESS